MERFKGKGREPRHIKVSLNIKGTFIDAYIFNLANKASVFVHLNEGALKGNGEIYYKGGVDKFTFYNVEARFSTFFGSFLLTQGPRNQRKQDVPYQQS